MWQKIFVQWRQWLGVLGFVWILKFYLLTCPKVFAQNQSFHLISSDEGANMEIGEGPRASKISLKLVQLWDIFHLWWQPRGLTVCVCICLTTSIGLISANNSVVSFAITLGSNVTQKTVGGKIISQATIALCLPQVRFRFKFKCKFGNQVSRAQGNGQAPAGSGISIRDGTGFLQNIEAIPVFLGIALFGIINPGILFSQIPGSGLPMANDQKKFLLS